MSRPRAGLGLAGGLLRLPVRPVPGPVLPSTPDVLLAPLGFEPFARGGIKLVSIPLATGFTTILLGEKVPPDNLLELKMTN